MSGLGTVEELRRSARSEQLRARAPRILFIGLVVILSLAGLKSIVSGADAAPTEDTAAGMVDQATEDFAMRFARAYLTYDVANPDLRERQLAAYVPNELDSNAGLTPARGSQNVEWMQVAQHQEALAGGVVIVVAAQLDTRKEPIYLAVPVERRPDDALQLVNYPSIVGPPTVSRAPAPTFEEVDDPQLSATVERVVRNYVSLSSENLAADLAPDAEVSMPAEAMKVQSVVDVTWATTPDNPAVIVTVEARDSMRALWTLAYEVGIDQSGDRTTATYVETVPDAT